MQESSPKPLKKPRTQDATGIVKLVSQEEFLKFIAAPCAIIQAGDGAAPDAFPVAITLRLGVFHVPPVRLGVVNLSDIDWTPQAKLYVRFNLPEVKQQPDGMGRPPAGFYLFVSGKLVGFHTGQVDLEKDGNALGFGVVAGLLGALTQSKEVAYIGLHAAMWKAGERVAEAFAEWLQNFFSSQSANMDSETEAWRNEAQERAYAAFGLPVSASDEEVLAAHKRLVRESHPDRFGHDPAGQEQATRRTAELNAARDFILKRRARR
jgi:DnaJ like chaperone protein